MSKLIKRATTAFAVLALFATAFVAVGASTEERADAAWGYPATLDCLAVVSAGPVGTACYARQNAYDYDLWRKSSVGIVLHGRFGLSFDNSHTLASATNALFAQSGQAVWTHGTALFAWGFVAVTRSSCNTSATGWYLCPFGGTYPAPGNTLTVVHVRQ